MTSINKKQQSINNEDSINYDEDEYLSEKVEKEYDENIIDLSNIKDFDNSLRVSIDLINKINNIVEYQTKQLKKEINKALNK